jgi:hypothetical protein
MVEQTVMALGWIGHQPSRRRHLAAGNRRQGNPADLRTSTTRLEGAAGATH